MWCSPRNMPSNSRTVNCRAGCTSRAQPGAPYEPAPETPVGRDASVPRSAIRTGDQPRPQADPLCASRSGGKLGVLSRGSKLPESECGRAAANSERGAREWNSYGGSVSNQKRPGSSLARALLSGADGAALYGVAASLVEHHHQGVSMADKSKAGPSHEKGTGSAPDLSGNDDRSRRFDPNRPEKTAADKNEAEQAKRRP